MPRNKGYTPMRAATVTESPINTFKMDSFNTMTTPRYTSTPTQQQQQQNELEMPLVSESENEDEFNSNVANKVLRRADSGMVLRPKMGLKNRRAGELMEEGNNSWSSLPETIGEELEDEDDDKLDTMSLRSTQMDIHEKRRMMMAKMRTYKTQVGFVTPKENNNVPPELLEKRRVLQKTLNQVRSQWTSMPAIDPRVAAQAMRMNAERQNSKTPPPMGSNRWQQQQSTVHFDQSPPGSPGRYGGPRSGSSMGYSRQVSYSPPPPSEMQESAPVRRLQHQYSLSHESPPQSPSPVGPTGPPPQSRRQLPRLPPVRQRSMGQFTTSTPPMSRQSSLVVTDHSVARPRGFSSVRLPPRRMNTYQGNVRTELATIHSGSSSNEAI